MLKHFINTLSLDGVGRKRTISGCILSESGSESETEHGSKIISNLSKRNRKRHLSLSQTQNSEGPSSSDLNIEPPRSKRIRTKSLSSSPIQLSPNFESMKPNLASPNSFSLPISPPFKINSKVTFLKTPIHDSISLEHDTNDITTGIDYILCLNFCIY